MEVWTHTWMGTILVGEWSLTEKYGHIHGLVDNTLGWMAINRKVWTRTWICRQYSWMNGH